MQSPAPGHTVAAPKTVVLRFSEPTELRFSTFKVVPLPTGTTPDRAAADALARKDDGAVRADTAPRLSGVAARLGLPLRPHLKPGAYLVAWRVLSDDGHPVTGHTTFTVR